MQSLYCPPEVQLRYKALKLVNLNATAVSSLRMLKWQRIAVKGFLLLGFIACNLFDC